MIQLILGYLLYVIYVNVGHGTACRDYYFGFSTDTMTHSADPKSSLAIVSSSTSPVQYSIETRGIRNDDNGSITNESTYIKLREPAFILIESLYDHNKGVHLRICNDEVTVIGQDLLPNTGDTFLSLPIVDLGSLHLVYYGVSVPKQSDSASEFNSTILVVGTQNCTIINLTVTQPVTISDSNSTIDLTAGKQYSFVINRLQTVLIGSVDDLTGTKIVTNKPVSVLSGHQCAYIPTHIKKCNHLVEQVPPTIVWGKVYYTAPLATRMSYTIKVLAAYNSTVVDIYCNNSKESYNIREGQSFNKILSQKEYCAITSNKEIFLAQFSHGQSDDRTDGDAMMMLVPARYQFSNRYQSSTLQGQSGFTHHITIIVLAQYFQPDMIYLMSGGEHRLLDTHQWTPIMVNSVPKAYSSHVTIISLGAIEVVHNDSNAGLAVLSYGFCKHQAYGHPGKCSNNSGSIYVQVYSIVMKCIYSSWMFLCI